MQTNIAKQFQKWVQGVRSGRLGRSIIVIVLLVATFLATLDWTGTPASIDGSAEARDGDSLVIGRHRVRLVGIDAPERDQTCSRGRKRWACGREAGRHLSRLIGNHDVNCMIEKRDRFQRLLAHCRVSERDLNRSMVRDGMALSFGRRYRREEAAARKEKLGLWSGTFQRPQLWRKQNPRR
ncbi:MAG: endonuclease YncB(thermonuclease family) [Hyphomicrobiaceae bacterium]|jgi:endonuclease YncB( thermonuclease family)